MEFNLFGVKIKINKEYLVLAAVILIVIIGFAVYRFFSADSDLIIDASANANGQQKSASRLQAGPAMPIGRRGRNKRKQYKLTL